MAYNNSSLYQLQPELVETLEGIQSHLSEYAEEQETSELDEALDLSAGLSSVLRLLELPVAAKVIDAVEAAMKKTRDEHSTSFSLLALMSETLMLIQRYLEFVLIHEHPAQFLLVEALNKLHMELELEPLSFYEACELEAPAGHELDAWPQFESKRLKESVLHILQSSVNDHSQEAVDYVQKAAAILSEKSGSTGMKHLSEVCAELKDKPHTHASLYLFMLLERAQHNTQVNQLCAKDLDFIYQSLFDQSQATQVPKFADWISMERFLHGPTKEVIQVINELIQNELHEIKQSIDDMAASSKFSEEDAANIASSLRSAALRLHMLGLSSAAKAIMLQAKSLAGWSSQGDESSYNALLKAILEGENASALLAKAYQPGAVQVPLNHDSISIHQLGTSYTELVVQARSSLAQAEKALSAYAGDSKRDPAHLGNLPLMLSSVGGALLFINVPNGHKLLNHASKFVAKKLDTLGELNPATIECLADVICAADVFLESIEQQRPLGEMPLVRGARALKQALAA